MQANQEINLSTTFHKKYLSYTAKANKYFKLWKEEQKKEQQRRKEVVSGLTKSLKTIKCLPKGTIIRKE
jgi:hypothetical protein